jgi:hypothetical protein
MSYDPFIEPFGNRGSSRAPRGRPNSALVLYRQGAVETFEWPEEPRRSGLARWSRYDKVYRIDMRPHRLEWWLTVPSKGGVFTFEADVQAICRVVEPQVVIEADAHDPLELLKPSVVRLIRQVSRDFNIQQSVEAEAAVRQQLAGRPLVESGFELDKFDVQLRLDKEARHHVADLRRIEYESERAIKTAQVGSELEKEKRKELKSGVDFYQELIDRGPSAIWAIQLARSPDAIPYLIARIREQDTNKQALLRELFDAVLVTMLEKSDIEERDVREDLVLLWRSMVKAFDGLGAETGDGRTRAIPPNSPTLPAETSEQSSDPASTTNADTTTQQPPPG